MNISTIMTKFTLCMAIGAVGSMMAQAVTMNLNPITPVTNDYWPENPTIQTVNPFASSINTGSFGVTSFTTGSSESRIAAQSFVVNEAFTVGSIYLSAKLVSAINDFEIVFLKMGDGVSTRSTNSVDWYYPDDTTFTGTIVKNLGSSADFIGRPSSTYNGAAILELQLTEDEQFDLEAGNYILALSRIKGTSTAIDWVYQSPGSGGPDAYADGLTYMYGTSSAGWTDGLPWGPSGQNRAFGMALNAVPEPSTSAFLIIFSGLSGVMVRRR